MEIDQRPEWFYNGLYTWTIVEPDYQFKPGQGLPNTKQEEQRFVNGSL